MNNASSRRHWTLIVFSFVALSGVALQTRGALVPSFRQTYGVSESRLGLLTVAGSIGFVPIMLTFGFVAGHIDIRRFLFLGVFGTSGGLIIISFAPTYWTLLALVGFQMGAYGIFRALDRPVMSHLYPESRGRIFSLQAMIWSVGATSWPILVTLLSTHYSWRVIYLLLGIMFLPTLAGTWLSDLPECIEQERSFSGSDLRSLISRPPIYGMGQSLVLVGSLVSVFFTWLPYYATQFLSRLLANLTLTILLAAYIPSRRFSPWVSERHPVTVVPSTRSRCFSLRPSSLPSPLSLWWSRTRIPFGRRCCYRSCLPSG